MLSRGFLLVLIALIFIAGIHSTVAANAETPICGSSSSSSSLSSPCRFAAQELRLDHLPILLLTGSENSSQTLQDNEVQYDTENSNSNRNDNNGNIEREIPSVVSAIPFP